MRAFMLKVIREKSALRFFIIFFLISLHLSLHYDSTTLHFIKKLTRKKLTLRVGFDFSRPGKRPIGPDESGS